MGVNIGLKAELVRRFGSQVEAAKAMGLRENRLSYIVRGHVQPSDAERNSLEHTLGKAVVRKTNDQMLQRAVPKDFTASFVVQGGNGVLIQGREDHQITRLK